MYDETIQNVEETAEEHGLVTLIPTTNMAIVKKADEVPEVRDFLENLDEERSDVELTWTENTAEIRVK